MRSEKVVDSTDATALAEEGKFCLRVLTHLDTLVHGANDVCFGQQLVRNRLAGPLQLQACYFRKPPWKQKLTSKHHWLSTPAGPHPGLAKNK